MGNPAARVALNVSMMATSTQPVSRRMKEKIPKGSSCRMLKNSLYCVTVLCISSRDLKELYTQPPEGRKAASSFQKSGTKVQRSEVTSPRSHSTSVA